VQAFQFAYWKQHYDDIFHDATPLASEPQRVDVKAFPLNLEVPERVYGKALEYHADDEGSRVANHPTNGEFDNESEAGSGKDT